MRYISNIDGLRAGSVSLVFLAHSYPKYFPGGFVGVDIFFAISGFLITVILIDEARVHGNPSILKFYSRRILRIFPALFACVGICAVLAHYVATGLVSCNNEIEIPAALFGFMNIIRAFTKCNGWIFGHTWSLGEEEQFYFVWVGIVWFVAKNGKTSVLVKLTFFGFLLSGLWRIFIFFHGGSADRIYNGPDTHCDGLLAGCALACIHDKIPEFQAVLARLWSIPAIFIIVTLLTISYDFAALNPILPSLIALVSMWLLVGATKGGKGGVLGVLHSRPAIWLGKRSYSFYVWHYPILSFAAANLSYSEKLSGWPLSAKLSHFVAFIVSFAFSLLASHLSYIFVERPFLTIRHRGVFDKPRI